MPKRNISPKLLECFCTLVQTQSFTKTAEQLCITQPTVSKHLQQLEKQLGVSLLMPDKTLTEIGVRIYQHAQQLLQQQHNLFQDIENYQNLQVGTLNMGVPPLGAQLLTSSLFEFHRQCPNIQLSFLEVGSKGIKQALINNELDVGVLLEPIEDLFHRIELCDYPLMVVLRHDAVWAKRPSIALQELSEQSFLMFQENFSLNEVILNACQQQGFTPHIVCRSSQWNLLADMVYQRMGIALLPKYYTDMLEPKKFTAVELVEPQLRWHLAMAWKKNKVPSPALQQWLQIIVKNA